MTLQSNSSILELIEYQIMNLEIKTRKEMIINTPLGTLVDALCFFLSEEGEREVDAYSRLGAF